MLRTGRALGRIPKNRISTPMRHVPCSRARAKRPSLPLSPFALAVRGSPSRADPSGKPAAAPGGPQGSRNLRVGRGEWFDASTALVSFIDELNRSGKA